MPLSKHIQSHLPRCQYARARISVMFISNLYALYIVRYKGLSESRGDLIG